MPFLTKKWQWQIVLKNQRAKIVVLPKIDNINEFQKRLDVELERCIKVHTDHFHLTTWVMLNKALLVKVMVFNRKRPGDVEKSQIIEYENLQMVDEEHVRHLEDSEKDVGKMYGRYITREKLDRLLLSY
ncbi:hypothetical protein NQ314_014604 [Rhamnusium bicolor]|uniref:Uncharacterized protein n=1 Tax=Rhamnusium bicolor TaxID=1586634 RepID=A0AAV8X1T0_9CUCU|nr:hypothetical protein NQ314_014604 [Rhamnusium bicolor]